MSKKKKKKKILNHAMTQSLSRATQVTWYVTLGTIIVLGEQLQFWANVTKRKSLQEDNATV